MTGIGFSLQVVSSNILLSEYFDRKRPLALIFSVTGGGIGIVVFPHIFTTLNQTYGIHGTFLILSALNCHGIMFSILYDVSLANSKPSEYPSQLLYNIASNTCRYNVHAIVVSVHTK